MSRDHRKIRRSSELKQGVGQNSSHAGFHNVSLSDVSIWKKLDVAYWIL